MKKLAIILTLFLVISTSIFAQVGINNDGSAPHNSAMLDVKATDRGLLIPRISSTARDTIHSPATGLLIYNTTTNLFNYYNGNYWHQLATAFITPATGTRHPGGGVSINASPETSPDSSAMLDADNPARGILITRTIPELITNPATGLIIYNTATNRLSFFNGSQWISLCAVSTGIPGAAGSQPSIGMAIKTDNSGTHPSAILEVAANDKGVLIPRLSDVQRDSILPVTGLVIYNTSANGIEFFDGTAWYRLITDYLAAPGAATLVPSLTQIIWNWSAVPGASGYKWNTLNEYNSAIDLSSATSTTEPGLTCNTSYIRYVWAYSNCGISIPLTLTQTTLACFTCGSSFNINHVAGTVAPVTKTVTYAVVTSIPGETSKCWITRNLGASQQATSVTDNTEPSSGWYWQFNRKQGFKHDGSTRTPNTTWTTSINDNSNWTVGNDPCAIELGGGWRVPTNTEWTNVDASGSWTNYNGPWNSGLKMHASGYLSTSGSVSSRGSYGYYWSSTQYNSTTGYYLTFRSSASSSGTNAKATGCTVRCIKEPVPAATIPAVSTSGVSNITQSDAIGGGNVTSHGGAVVTARGICWSTSPNPVITGNHTTNGTGTGEFTGNLTELSPNTTYYVRAYATNSVGTAYGNQVTFSTAYFDCGQPFFDFRDGKTYSTKLIGSQCWMAQNLNIGTKIPGISEQESNGIIEKYCFNDDEANCLTYGGLYQWNEIFRESGFMSGLLFVESFEGGNGSTPPPGWSIEQVSGTTPGISFVSSSSSPNVSIAFDGTTFVKYSSWSISSGSTRLKCMPISTTGRSSINIDFAWHEDPAYSSSVDKVYLQWSTDGTTWNTAGDFLRYNSLIGWKVKNVALPSGASNQPALYIGFLFESHYGNNCFLDFVRVSSQVSGGICPSGWHLPNEDEWNVLTNYLGGHEVAGGKMKESENVHWAVPNTDATNTSGFTALPAGFRHEGGIFGNLQTDAGFWSSGDTTSGGWSRTLQHSEGGVSRIAEDKSNGISLRCIREITPTVTTAMVANVNQISATSGGTVTTDGGALVLARGVCWSTSTNPAVNGPHTSNGYGSGAFISNITGLLPGTTYYIRAYATNNIGTSYGEEISFTTLPPGLPVLSTATVSYIFQASAISGGNITDDGALLVTTRGVCWSNSSNPTLADSHTSDGTGKGFFTSSIQGLMADTVYHVRAYATNSLGTGYGHDITFNTLSDSICGSFLTINHVAGAVAPVSRTVTYGLVSNIPGEPLKCWITSNLGADRQANAYNDTSDLSAGWYWQYNRKQGYKYQQTSNTRTPNSVWINSINENLDWQAANDPCTVELGNGWRIPSYTEWSNVNANFTGSDTNKAWKSGLKIHAAGNLLSANGSISGRGTSGRYWIGSTSLTTSNFSFCLDYSYSATNMNDREKAYGLSLRCVKDSPYAVAPVVTTVAVTAISQYLATSGGNVTSDGGAWITARGVCWSLTPNPTILDNYTTNGTGTGTFISNLSGLLPDTVYHLKAYASNGAFTGYGNEVVFRTLPVPVCGYSITVNHVAGTVDPVSKTVTYDIVSNIPGEPAKCWISRNLGASQQATAVNDATEASAGWLWQFNRKQGFKMEGSVRTPNTTWITSISENSDWLAANDPCALDLGSGWRIPTNTEWSNTDASGNWVNWNTPWNSPLKIHSAGVSYDGTLSWRGSIGWYWSNKQYYLTAGYYLNIGSGNCDIGNNNKSHGYAVRCIKDAPFPLPVTLTTDNVVNITQFTATSGGNIIADGGAIVSERGICWNTSPGPTINNSHIASGNGTGPFSVFVSGLTLNTQYYLRAYSASGAGISYGNEIVFSTLTESPCGTSVTINHVAGSVAPVSKTVTYGIVTNISGEPSKCWITRNLGASQQATAVSDATEPSAGWYWQFNRKQGYKHDGTSRTPNTTWITSISENLDWQAANDPCTIELGTGWRIPTAAEWINVNTSNGWTNWNGPWNSPLKLHAAGQLVNTTGSLNSRGVSGFYYSSFEEHTTSGHSLYFNSSSSSVAAYNYKASAFPVRCINDCISLPGTPASNGHIPSATQIIWKWTTTSGAMGYKWNTTNDYATATDLLTAVTKTETGLDCDSIYTRFIWAYNTCGNSAPVTLQQITLPCSACGAPITVNHLAGVVAPVTKTVVYGTVDNISGEPLKCWITQNLGAGQQASAVSDTAEAAAGWYWQFNRMQGYKHNGTTRTPNTTWIDSFNENSDWTAANDPCAIELGNGWRIPVSSEWINVDAGGSWTNSTGPWSSGLKMHMAGFLTSGGSLTSKGSAGNYVSSTQSNSENSMALVFAPSICYVSMSSKGAGLSLRCVRDQSILISIPGVTTVSATNVLQNSAISGGNVTGDGGSPVVERGVCWSTLPSPTLAGTHTSDGSDTGVFVSNITGLIPNTLYYLRAYAINSTGIAYGNEIYFISQAATNCPVSLTINHEAGMVAPETKSITYGIVANVPGEPLKCWISRNLGAAHQATKVNDTTEEAAGWYWQFNRKQGYKHDGTLRTPNTSWITSISETSDWITANDPCAIELGTGWRIPTSTEWTNVDAGSSWNNWNGPFGSTLKLHAAGYLFHSDGSLYHRGSNGNYWSSTQKDAADGWILLFYISWSNLYNYGKANGFPARCIRDY